MVAEGEYQLGMKKGNMWIVGVDYSKTNRFMFGKGEAKGLRSYLTESGSKVRFLYNHSSARDHKLSLTTGSTIEGKSFKYPESFTAEPVDYLVVEDADTINEDFYLQYIRPRIIDTKGRIWINGKMPLKKNWLVNLWKKYYYSPVKDYAYAFKFSMYDNPYLELGEIEGLANDLPIHLRKSIINGDEPEADSSLFGNLEERFKGSITPYIQGHTYQAGIDIGRTYDRTILAISDLTDKRLAFIDIFPPKFFKTDLVEARFIKDLKLYRNPLTYIDTSSIGTQFEFLAEKYEFIKVYPVNSLKVRNSLIEGVSIAMERGYTLPDIQYIKNEFSNLDIVVRKNYILYVSASGFHDDTIIAVGESLKDCASRFDESPSQRIEPEAVEGDVTEDDFLKIDNEPVISVGDYALR